MVCNCRAPAQHQGTQAWAEACLRRMEGKHWCAGTQFAAGERPGGRQRASGVAGLSTQLLSASCRRRLPARRRPLHRPQPLLPLQGRARRWPRQGTREVLHGGVRCEDSLAA